MVELLQAGAGFAVALIAYLAGHWQGTRETEDRYKLRGRR
jgi:hypothetical protein